jgi:hypothetical protein
MMGFSYTPINVCLHSIAILPIDATVHCLQFKPMYGNFMKRIPMYLLLFSVLLSLQAEAQIRGFPFAPRVGSLRLGMEGGVGVLGSDLTHESQNYHFRPIANTEIAYVFHKNFAVGLYGGGGFLRSTYDEFESNTDFWNAGLLLEFRVPALRGSVFPIVQLRGGGIQIRPEQRIGRESYEFPASWNYSYGGAVGVEVVSWHRLGIRALFGVTYTSTDEWDMITRGNDNDGYSWAALSLHYYFVFRR